MPRLSRRDYRKIADAFSKVRASAGMVADGDDSAKDRSYDDIFALNNEVGRVARQEPALMPKMRELQLRVNMITVGIKYSRVSEIREGLSVAGEAIASFEKDLPSAP